MAEPVTDPSVDPATGLPIDSDPTMDEPGWDVDSDGNVDVAGLKVPGPLAVKVVAAMRAGYPEVTADLSDVRAVRAVLKHWVTATVMTYAAQQVHATAAEQIQAMQDQAAQKAAQAAEAAAAAAATITEAPPTPVTPAPAPDPSA